MVLGDRADVEVDTVAASKGKGTALLSRLTERLGAESGPEDLSVVWTRFGEDEAGASVALSIDSPSRKRLSFALLVQTRK